MKYKLSELMDVIGGGTPKTSKPEYWNGNIPWLSVKDFNNDRRYVYQTEKNITKEGLENSSTKLLDKGDMIVSARGTVGEIASIPYQMAFNQSCYGLRAKEDLIASDFLYYLIKHNIDILKKQTHGSVFDTITKDTFDGIEVDIPDLDEQKRIASLLSDLDNKIELNIKINENLLQQALAIYKAWFCDYVLSDGVLPESWHVTTIDALSSLVTRGIAPKYDDSSNQIVLNQKCIRDHTIDVSLARRHLPKKINEKWISKGDLLINSTGTGTLGRVAQVWFDAKNITVDSHITFVRPKAPILQSYVGFWGLSHEGEIEAQHTGSTGQTELPRDRVKAMELPLPDSVTLEKFNALIIPMTNAIVSNQEENTRLYQLRDTLLPRLMSGELDVSDINL
ncbi:restriction endonuclease subunit S [Emergencia sp. JLR.KK010]|uniref:restriction endonuclease subunit S n=1 Tax=Emergencia sp. JLR.KK010 TaxID=3114296 RepID=UPI0030CC8597